MSTDTEDPGETGRVRRSGVRRFAAAVPAWHGTGQQRDRSPSVGGAGDRSGRPAALDDQPGTGPNWRRTAIALKASLAALLLFALVHPDWERFADKAMGARALTYPLAALLVPAIWTVSRRVRRGRDADGRPPRGGSSRYPWDVDAFLVAPFVIDVAGNAADLFDTVGWFDDACHFANWALVSAAVGAALRRGPAIPAPVLALLCSGIGAIAAILWELAEYLTFIMKTDETVGIYRDTMGDELLGLAGATLAGVLTAVRARRGPRRPDAPRTGGAADASAIGRLSPHRTVPS